MLAGSIGVGTLVAVGFAAVLDVAVGTTWLGWDLRPIPSGAWWVLAVLAWVASAAWTGWMLLSGDASGHRGQVDRLLVEAQRQQLRGELKAAAESLERILRLCPEDCEAMVYLAGIYKRQGREDDARRVWRRCRVHDWHDKWAWEADVALRP